MSIAPLSAMDTTRTSAPRKASRHQHFRTRDENQERAYIAASRRTDRSIEARLQSAHKASELHQKRTGKALRITEQIVFNDETYEEEDSWLPSRFLLGPQLQTPSADLNARVEAFLEQKIVMSTLVAATDRQRQNLQWSEIDRLFAESFPHAAQTARRLAEDLVPPASSVLRDQQGQVEEKGDAVQGAPAADAEMRMQEADLETGFPSEMTVGADASFFTPDLPAEVLMFLGQEGDLAPNQDKHTDASFTDADTGFSLYDDAAQRPTEESIWDDDLDAYLDSSAWLDFPAEDQTFT